MTDETSAAELGGPTKALPGSAEKLRIIAARRRANLPLFHPGDANPTREAAAEAVMYGDTERGATVVDRRGREIARTMKSR